VGARLARYREEMRRCGRLRAQSLGAGVHLTLPVQWLGSPAARLALSTTALGAGQAVFQNTFSLQRTDAYDILDPRLETKSLTLAQAVITAPAFPTSVPRAW